MSDEEKLNKCHILILAIGVVLRRMINDGYLLAGYKDAVTFILTKDANDLIAQAHVINDVLSSAASTIEKEKDE
ncbi:MAG TPA: hypothetical protein VH815_08715 [Acidobacteriota bacterium]